MKKNLDRVRIAALSFLLVCVPGCGTTGKVGVDVRRWGITVEWDLTTGQPIAKLSNSSSKTVCMCVYPMDDDGESTGLPSHVVLPPNSSLDAGLPDGTERYRTEIVDCDDEDPCEEEDEEITLGPPGNFAFARNKATSRYWEVYSRDVGLPEREYVSYDIEVTAAGHSERIERLEQVLDGNTFIPVGVEIRELRVMTPMYDQSQNFAGTRLVVTQDEPVQGLALLFNGTNVAFESGYTQANGYWHYTAYVPAVLMNFSTTDTVSNTIEVTHVSADDGFVQSSNTFTWYP